MTRDVTRDVTRSEPGVLSPRAIGAGIGLAVVLVTYGASGVGDDGRWWAALVAIGLAVVLADALAVVRRLLPIPGVAPLTVVAVLVAVYLCVPETDQVPVAAIVPVAVVVMEIVGRRQVGIEWYAMAAASVGWAGLFGASGRQSALVGALFSWWAVVLLPLVRLLWSPVWPHVRTRLWHSRSSECDEPAGTGRGTVVAVIVAVIGAVSAGVMARTGGIDDSASVAWVAAAVIAVVSLVVAFVMTFVVARPAPRSR